MRWRIIIKHCGGGGTRFVGVVKADAYGHGSVQVSRVLEELGADYLAVSSLDEAMELRAGGITMPILILGHTPPERVEELLRYHITQAVTCEAKALEYSAEAVRCGGTLKIHIKVDTGMSRLGFLCGGDHFETGVAGICAACTLPGLEAEGIFTHFAVSDEADTESDAYTRGQFDLFCRVIGAVEQRLGRRFPCGTAPTPGRWPGGRRRIWIWCGRGCCCMAAVNLPGSLACGL
ncbi:MAG: alanine racemase [Oscillospiraceae bacterium]